MRKELYRLSQCTSVQQGGQKRTGRTCMQGASGHVWRSLRILRGVPHKSPSMVHLCFALSIQNYFVLSEEDECNRTEKNAPNFCTKIFCTFVSYIILKACYRYSHVGLSKFTFAVSLAYMLIYQSLPKADCLISESLSPKEMECTSSCVHLLTIIAWYACFPSYLLLTLLEVTAQWTFHFCHLCYAVKSHLSYMVSIKVSSCFPCYFNTYTKKTCVCVSKIIQRSGEVTVFLLLFL